MIENPIGYRKDADAKSWTSPVGGDGTEGEREVDEKGKETLGWYPLRGWREGEVN